MLSIILIISKYILRHNYPSLCFPWFENPETLRQVHAFLSLRSALD